MVQKDSVGAALMDEVNAAGRNIKRGLGSLAADAGILPNFAESAHFTDPGEGVGGFVGDTAVAALKFGPAIANPALLPLVATEAAGEAIKQSQKAGESVPTQLARGTVGFGTTYLGGKLFAGEGASLLKSIATQYGGGAAIQTSDAIANKVIDIANGKSVPTALEELGRDLPEQIVKGGAQQLFFHALHVGLKQFNGQDRRTPRSQAYKAGQTPPAQDSAPPSETPLKSNAAVKAPEQEGNKPASPPNSDANGPTVGIAHRVTEARGADAQRGVGIAPEDSVQHGRELLAQGSDPQQAVTDFEKSKAITADSMALVRAHAEQLAKVTNAAADGKGTDSPEYKVAWQAEKDWIARIKPMQTEWHKIGQAQQGETEIDTGTFHGLQRAYFDATGKDFTPGQAEQAKRTAERVQRANQGVEAVSNKLKAAVNAHAGKSKEPVDVTAHPAGSKMTPERVKALWEHAKTNYIDKGITNLTDIAHRLAIDFGLPVTDIRHGLAAPKSMRAITNEVYAAQSKRRLVTEQAKRWVKGAGTPGWLRAIKAVPGALFSAKVFGHGTVGMITHAGNQAFNAPGTQASRAWFRNFAKQFPLAYSAAYHEQAMQYLERRANYTTARRAGLANDVNQFKDEYQSALVAKLFGKLGIAGNRGFDALKLMRQDLFDQRWEAMPASLRTPEMAKDIALSVNHATGFGENIAGKGKLGQAASVLLFAPKLEGSRWGYLVGDPIVAAKRFANWKNETPEARAAALSEVKQKALQAATYMGALAINQAILSASNSDDKINFTDPSKADWLSFKVAGHNVGIVGPLLGSIRYLVNLEQAAFGARSKLEKASSSRADKMAEVTGKYLRKKLSPFGALTTDVVTQSDFQKRPLPFSRDQIPTYLRREGIKPLGYGEYITQTLLPIPAEDAVREVWKNQGMSESQINTYLKAIAVGAVVGGTGARVTDQIPERPEPAGPSYKQQLNDKSKNPDPQMEYFKHLTLVNALAEYKVANPTEQAKMQRPLEEKRLRDSVGNLEAKEKLKQKLTPIEQTTLRRNKNKLAEMERQDKVRKKR